MSWTAAEISQTNDNRVFLENLAYGTSDETLARYCQTFGDLTECRIARDDKQTSCGYGFVSFCQKTVYDQFIEQRSHLIDNRRVNVQPSLPRKSKGQKRKRLSSMTRTNKTKLSTINNPMGYDYRDLLDRYLILEQDKRHIENELEQARQELQRTLFDVEQIRIENVYLKSKCDYLQKIYEMEESAEIDVETIDDDDDDENGKMVATLEERCHRLEERLNKLEQTNDE